MEGRWLSQPRYCSKGVQVVPKAVLLWLYATNKSQQWDSTLGSQAPLSCMLWLDHCDLTSSPEQQPLLSGWGIHLRCWTQVCLPLSLMSHRSNSHTTIQLLEKPTKVALHNVIQILPDLTRTRQENELLRLDRGLLELVCSSSSGTDKHRSNSCLSSEWIKA